MGPLVHGILQPENLERPKVPQLQGFQDCKVADSESSKAQKY